MFRKKKNCNHTQNINSDVRTNVDIRLGHGVSVNITSIESLDKVLKKATKVAENMTAYTSNWGQQAAALDKDYTG